MGLSSASQCAWRAPRAYSGMGRLSRPFQLHTRARAPCQPTFPADTHGYRTHLSVTVINIWHHLSLSDTACMVPVPVSLAGGSCRRRVPLGRGWLPPCPSPCPLCACKPPTRYTRPEPPRRSSGQSQRCASRIHTFLLKTRHAAHTCRRDGRTVTCARTGLRRASYALSFRPPRYPPARHTKPLNPLTVRRVHVPTVPLRVPESCGSHGLDVHHYTCPHRLRHSGAGGGHRTQRHWGTLLPKELVVGSRGRRPGLYCRCVVNVA